MTIHSLMTMPIGTRAITTTIMMTTNTIIIGHGNGHNHHEHHHFDRNDHGGHGHGPPSPISARQPPARPGLHEAGRPGLMFDYIRDPAEITRRSFEIIGAATELSGLPADIAPVAARIVHACGMPDVLPDLAFSKPPGRLAERR
jgi:hypothetical protein